MATEPSDETDLSIEIDADLLAAAVSAVESRQKRGSKKKFAPSRFTEEVGDPVTIDLEAEAAAAVRGLDEAMVEPEPQRPNPKTGTPSGSRVSRAAAEALRAASDERQLLRVRLNDATDRLVALEAELLRMTEQRDELDKQYREFREAAHRMQQDGELTRQRARKEREEAERAAEERTLRAVLDIVDNVERGLQYADQNPTRVVAGMNMIAEQFRLLLPKVNVERVEASPGLLFDPILHEAVLHLPTREMLAGCIVNEVAAGFKLRGRLIRPARVVVAAEPPEST